MSLPNVTMQPAAGMTVPAQVHLPDGSTVTTFPTMSARQAALLVLVASILKKGAPLDDAEPLASAIENVAFELAALGIQPPA